MNTRASSACIRISIRSCWPVRLSVVVSFDDVTVVEAGAVASSTGGCQRPGGGPLGVRLRHRVTRHPLAGGPNQTSQANGSAASLVPNPWSSGIDIEPGPENRPTMTYADRSPKTGRSRAVLPFPLFVAAGSAGFSRVEGVVSCRETRGLRIEAWRSPRRCTPTRGPPPWARSWRSRGREPRPGMPGQPSGSAGRPRWPGPWRSR
jgi:hypothetical protein